MRRRGGALVVVNRGARAARDGAALEQVCEAAGARLVFTADRGQVRRVVGEYLGGRSPGEGRVVLVGGDGTHMVGVSELGRAVGSGEWPRVGLVAGGTVNTTARTWGFGGWSPGVLRRLLGGDAVEMRPTLRLVDERGEQHLGFIWGAGLVGRFFERYNATGGGLVPAARLAVALTVGAVAGGATAREVLGVEGLRLTLDGRRVERDRFSLAVASVHPSVGLGIRVTYRAGERPGEVHLVASSKSPLGLGLASPRVLLGVSLGDVDALVKEARIELFERGVSILDGDLLEARALVLSAGPSIPVMSA